MDLQQNKVGDSKAYGQFTGDVKLIDELLLLLLLLRNKQTHQCVFVDHAQ